MKITRGFAHGLSALTLLLLPIASHGTTHYVHQGGGGDFTTINAAVTAATSGDTVLIAAGTYSGVSNTDVDPAGKELVIVSESGPEVTIVDCSGGTPYRRGFYFHTGEDTTAVLKGIHVTGGVAVKGGGVNCTGASPIIEDCIFSHCGVAYGGAMHIYESQAIVRNCEFLNNDVFVSGGALWVENATPVIASCVIDSCTAGFIAGGILLYDGGSATLRDVTIRNCSSGGDGAGIVCDGSPSYFDNVRFIANVADSTDGGGMYANCDITLTDCLFQSNIAGGEGGGVRCSGGTPTFTDCDFIDNESAAGGGIYSEEVQLEVSGGKFWNNLAGAGGGLYVYGGMPEITDVDFVANEAVILGGAICSEDALADIDGCTFEQNVSSIAGGAVWAGYVLMPNITNCFFRENDGTEAGGAIAFEEGFGGTVESCTFRGNAATTGAAIDIVGGSSPSITSCTLYGSVPSAGNGAISTVGSSPDIANTIIAGTENGLAVRCFGTPAPTTTHSCVFGNAAGDSLCGSYHDNMFADPLFCDAGIGDLTLHDDSPCLAANNAWSELVGALGVGGCGPGTGVDTPDILTHLVLFPATPNPFAGTTSIRYHVPTGTEVLEIGIYDVAGRMIRSTPGDVTPGMHETTWDGCDQRGEAVASGVYFVRAGAEGGTTQSTVVLIR